MESYEQEARRIFPGMRPVLDVCCGGKLFYYEPDSPIVTFMDKRQGEFNVGEGREIKISPTMLGDFTSRPWMDGGRFSGFSLVVFDPPHLIKAGPRSFMRAKYGVLGKDWKEKLSKGFSECFRVMRQDGVLVFKWSTSAIPIEEALLCSPYKPLLGDKRGHTRWTIFIKRKELERRGRKKHVD